MLAFCGSLFHRNSVAPSIDMQANEYDLVVIGSGPAGQKGAICAAKAA